MPSISLQLIILCTAVSVNILLAVLVYRNALQSATNRIFSLLSIVMSFWLVATYLSVTPVADLFWTKVTVASATVMTLTFFLLAHTFPESKLVLDRKKFVGVILYTLFVVGVCLSPFSFVGLEMSRGVLTAKPGPGMLPFALTTTVFSITAFYIFIRKYLNAQGVQRQQLKLIISGLIIMVSLIILTIMLPVALFQNDAFVQFAPVYALLFLITSSIAILRYHLFDVKLIATEILIGFLILATLIEGATSTTFQAFSLKVLFAVFVGFVGVLLVRSVKKEISQREQMAVLNSSLEASNEQLKSANLRLEQLDRQKTEFLSIASHQLRTPLSIINGYVELLGEGGYGKMPKDSLPIFESITENTEHLIKLINEFLDITHIEQGKTKFFFEQVDLTGMITKVVNQVSSQIKERPVTLVWKPSAKPLLVDVDKDKMRDIIFNLVDNAVKYTENGTVQVKVSVAGEQVTFAVKDQGLGFEEIDRVNFFQKFYRGKNVEGVNVTGTGLGLYVVKKFVEGHLGTISATSPGLHKGSEFSFVVPLHHEILSPSILVFPEKKTPIEPHD